MYSALDMDVNIYQVEFSLIKIKILILIYRQAKATYLFILPKLFHVMISTQKCSPHVCGQDLVLNVLGVVVSEVGRVQHVVPGEIQ